MATDSMTWVKANHTVKFGVDVRRAQFDQTLYYNVSGDYTFNSTTENSVFYNDNYPGYLLGLDDSYTQDLRSVKTFATRASMSLRRIAGK